GQGPLGRFPAALLRRVRHGGWTGGARGRDDDDVRRLLRFDPRPGRRGRPVHRHCDLFFGGRRTARAAGSRSAGLYRRPGGFAARVVHPCARRGPGVDGAGRDRPARRARPTARRADARVGSGEPRGVALLAHGHSGARHDGHRRAARALRRSHRPDGGGGAPPAAAGHAPRSRAGAAIAERTWIVVQQTGRAIAPAKGKLGVMPVAFDPNYVKRLNDANLKTGKTKRELAEQLRADIRTFKKTSGADRVMMIWAASTEVFLTPGPAHQSLAAFEQAMERNDHAIARS